MLTALFIFIGIVAYSLIGGFSVAKLFGPFPRRGDDQVAYVIGIIFWPISVVIGAGCKGVELASRKNDN